MAEFYFPERRLPYHLDGTQVLYRTYWVPSPPTRVLNTVVFNMHPAAVAALNSERRDAMLGNYQGSGDGVSYQVKDITFFFPVATEIEGIFFSAGASGIYHVTTSKDTTTTDDGTWEEAAQITGSALTSMAQFEAFPEGAPSTETQRRKMVNPETGAGVRESNGLDVLAVYRQRFVPGKGGIHRVSGDAFRGIVALRIERADGDSFFGQKLNAHLYGRAEPRSEQRLELVRLDGDRLRSSGLVLGNVPQHTGAAPNTAVASFRVRNMSNAQTAEDIVLSLTQIEDQLQSTVFPFFLFAPNPLSFFAFGPSPTGPWTTELSAGEGPVLSIGSLAPGAQSDPIYVRLATPSGLASSRYFGPLQVIIVPTPGGWS